MSGQIYSEMTNPCFSGVNNLDISRIAAAGLIAAYNPASRLPSVLQPNLLDVREVIISNALTQLLTSELIGAL